MEELWDGWNKVVGVAISTANKKHGDTYPFSNLFEELLQARIQKDFKDMTDTVKPPVEIYNEIDIQMKIATFLKSYWMWQDEIRLFEQGAGIDLKDNGTFDQLLDADKRALAALRDLKSSPRATILQTIDDGEMASRTGVFSR